MAEDGEGFCLRHSSLESDLTPVGKAISPHVVGIFERDARRLNVLDETIKVNGNVAFDLAGSEVGQFVPLGLLLSKDIDRSEVHVTGGLVVANEGDTVLVLPLLAHCGSHNHNPALAFTDVSTKGFPSLKSRYACGVRPLADDHHGV